MQVQGDTYCIINIDVNPPPPHLQREGQGAPPIVTLRATRSILSKIVRLSAAVELDRVPHLNAASISTFIHFTYK